MVTLDPGRVISQQRKTGGMGLREAIAAKAFNLLVNRLGKFEFVASAQHAISQFFSEVPEPTGAFPRGHRASQAVGLRGRKACGLHRQLHDLFLKNGNAERSFQDTFDCLRWVGHLLDGLSALEIRMHHAALNGPGTNDGDLHDKIKKLHGLEARQHVHLRA